MAAPLRSRRKKTIVKKRTPILAKEILKEDNSDELLLFAMEVIKEIKANHLDPTPTVFAAYYEKQLQKKSETFITNTNRLLQADEYDNKEIIRQEEQIFLDTVNISKKIFVTILNFQKNLILINKVLYKRMKESVSIASFLEKDINKLQNLLTTQTNSLKSYYSETALNVKNYDNKKIMNDEYNIYNYNYFKVQIQKEQKLIKEYKYASSVIAISISKKLMATINSKRTIKIVNKTIVKQLVKSLRKGDIVAYYKNDIFLLMLTHTNVTTAESLLQKISASIFHSNLFLGETEISITVSAGVSNISHSLTEEEIVDSAIESEVVL